MTSMHSLSTLEGQRLHYAAVRARLNPTPPRVRAPTLQLPPPAEEYTGDGIAPLNMLTTPSWRFLVTLASARTGVSVAEIMGRSRKHAIAAARHDAVALVYAYTNKSMVSVGKMFGGLDHTTILHIVRKLNAVKLIEPEIKAVVVAPVVVAKPKYAAPKAASKPNPKEGVTKPKHKPIGTALQRAVRRAYKYNIPPSALAEEYGCSPMSVKVIAHRMGLRRKSKHGDAGL